MAVLILACAVAIPVMIFALGGDDGGAEAGSVTSEFTTMAGSTSLAPTTTALSESTTTTAAPTTSSDLPQDEYQADVLLIQGLWQGFSASWAGGLQAGIDYIVAHNYPDLTCSVEDWLAYYRDELGWQEGDGEEVIVHSATIERLDDWGWVIPAGYPNAGEHPQGRIYVMSVDSTAPGAGGDAETHTLNLHTTVIGSVAYFFFECE